MYQPFFSVDLTVMADMFIKKLLMHMQLALCQPNANLYKILHIYMRIFDACQEQVTISYVSISYEVTRYDKDNHIFCMKNKWSKVNVVIQGLPLIQKWNKRPYVVEDDMWNHHPEELGVIRSVVNIEWRFLRRPRELRPASS